MGYRSRTQDIISHDLGNLRLGNGTIGSTQYAIDLADRLEETLRPAKFANALVSKMILDPIFAESQIAALSNLQFRPIGNAAANVLGISKEMGQLTAVLDSRNQLYQAYQRQVDEMFNAIRGPLNITMDNIARSVANTFDLSKPVMIAAQRAAEQYSASLDAIKVLGALAATPASQISIEESIRRLDPGHHIVKMVEGFQKNPVLGIANLVAEIKMPEPWLSSSLIATGLHTQRVSAAIRPSYSPPIELDVEGTDSSVFDERALAEATVRSRLPSSHSDLFNFEEELREFVSNSMEKVFGSEWIALRIGGNRLKNWKRFQNQRESKRSNRYPIIAYSYLKELKWIILNDVNWEKVFGDYFDDEKNILELMFDWILVVRNDIDHARIPTDDEHSQFAVAVRWISVRIEDGI